MAKDAYYFKHDADAKNDPNMLLCRSKYGAAGYGNYFMIIEMLRVEDGYRLPITKHTYRSISLVLQELSPDETRSFVDDLVDFALLSRDSKFIWSESLLRRMRELDALRQNRAAAGSKGAAARWGAKKSPPEKTEVEKSRKFKPPTVDEVRAYAKSIGYRSLNPQAFVDHYAANGWTRGKTKIKDWKACVRTWKARENPDEQEQERKAAAAKRRKANECKGCLSRPAEPFAEFCKDCSWCVVCDNAGRESRKDPKELLVAPEYKGGVCKTCYKLIE